MFLMNETGFSETYLHVMEEGINFKEVVSNIPEKVRSSVNTENRALSIPMDTSFFASEIKRVLQTALISLRRLMEISL